MKLNLLLIVLLFIGFISSCMPSNRREVEEVKIDLGHSPIKLSAIIDDVSYLKLDSDSNSLIGWITDIQFFDNKVFILDEARARALFVFSSTGDFLYKLNEANEVGLEFQLPIRMQIAKHDSSLYIYDPVLYSLSHYNLDGSFIEKLRINEPFNFFVMINEDSLLLDYGELVYEDHKLVLVDKNFQVLKRYLPSQNKVKSIGASLSLDADNIGYIPAMSNILYKYSNGELNEEMKFNFSSGWPDTKEKEYISSLGSRKWSAKFKEKYPFIYPHHETDEYVGLQLRFNKDDSYLYFINKQSKTVKGTNRFIDDLNIGEPGSLKGVDNNYFVCVLEPSDLIKNKNKYVDNKPLYALIEGLDKEDNQIIMKFRLNF